jgi:hypothetical protein
MRHSSVVLAIAIAACALGYAAARPPAASALSPRDRRVEQNIQLIATDQYPATYTAK